MKQATVNALRSLRADQDLLQHSADLQQLKGLLANEIVKKLERDGLTVRQAQIRTGVAAADFSRIRNADLTRFTLDRLVNIINRLGSRVEVKIKVRSAPRENAVALVHIPR